MPKVILMLRSVNYRRNFKKDTCANFPAAMIFALKNTKIPVIFPGRVREEAGRAVQRALREHAQVLLRLRPPSLGGERASH